MSSRGKLFNVRVYTIGAAIAIAAAALFALRAGSMAPAFGDPLPGLTPVQQTLFAEGKEEFQSVEAASEGLGPVFNGTSCAGCHSGPAIGGTSTLVETRFGRMLNGHFDPMAEFGGSLIQTTGIGTQAACEYAGETVPPEATIVAGRLTTPLFGLGLIDAVPDGTFQAIALLERVLTPATAGRPNMVVNLATSHLSVGKFGWKSQVPSVFQFSGDAYLNEMGITSPMFPNESCPQGDCGLLVCNPSVGIEDADGEDVAKFANFMRFLAAPPRGPVDASARAGEIVFVVSGCANCHTPTLQTGANPIVALNRVTFSPFSDFLLHDMGSLGDGIEQGVATGRDMRTAPLWGVRSRPLLLHDGRATTLEQAILAHDGQGRHARDAFSRLDPGAKNRLIAFLKSL